MMREMIVPKYKMKTYNLAYNTNANANASVQVDGLTRLRTHTECFD